MVSCYTLIFDAVILKQLKKVNKPIKEVLSKMFDIMEEKGPLAGNLLDSKLHLYEVKIKRPPIRLYYKYNLETKELYVFEFEMKTSEAKQKSTIAKLRKKSSKS